MSESASYLGFKIKYSDIVGSVFIPKYYNPEVVDKLEPLMESHEMVSIESLTLSNALEISTGDEIGKMAYGTGTIPFVRTSDISNWEIKTDPKQGVSEAIYQQYASKHDVKAGDILFVRDGTYLIGTACMVSQHDGPMLYQSHLLKLRLSEASPISSSLLLALLYSPIIRRQIKAKQFTADIIDSIGHRFNELVLPIPKDKHLCEEISREIQEIIDERGRLRERLRAVPNWAQGVTSLLLESPPLAEEDISERNIGYTMKSSQIRNNVMLPKYYEPTIEEELQALSEDNSLISLGELADQNVLTFATGIEVGKMAYDTGSVPFIRTSDISNWELKADPKQKVSEELYEATRAALDVQADDILVVRDGTYLVGTSCILTEHDTKVLYCGGIYKIRVNQKDQIDPYLLLTLLNTPIVRRQMKAKQFTRDVIDTLGKRLLEVVIPIPKNEARRIEIADEVKHCIQRRVELRNRSLEIVLQLSGSALVSEEEKQELAVL